MTPQKPYFIRALYEWILDNNSTPYLLVDTTHPNIVAPLEHADDEDRLILNISPTAAHTLVIGNEWVEFSARFGGVPRQIAIPIPAVLAIYARETGHGMGFSADENEEDTETDSEESQSSASPSTDQKQNKRQSTLKAVETKQESHKEDYDDDDPAPTRPRKRPSFTVIK